MHVRWQDSCALAGFMDSWIHGFHGFMDSCALAEDVCGLLERAARPALKAAAAREAAALPGICNRPSAATQCL